MRFFRLLVAFPLLLGILGCSRGGKFTLHQPFAPPAQRDLELRGHLMFASAEDARWKAVLAFPLPGSLGGERAFVVYLDAPEGPGRTEVGAAASAAKGFLIQEVGRLSGKTVFEKGTATIRKVLLKPNFRRLQVRLESSDGTIFQGKAVVQNSPTDVRAFEKQYQADVQQLRPTPTGDSTEVPAAPTASRPAGT